MGALLMAQDRLGEAEPLMRRAVEIFEQSLGAEHRKTQGARANLDALLAELAGS